MLATLVILGSLYGKVVDCAGGYGILVRLLRDCGIDALWSDRYCQNLVARGFEYDNGGAVLVTAFEAFEHFVHPDEDVDKLLAISPNVLLSTEIIKGKSLRKVTGGITARSTGSILGFSV